ncbi:MAG: phospho-N-acetylmuramoyl-pentapeptide-transferase [Bacteroidota bacterium]
MLYYLFKYLHETLHLPGAGVFKYISFRAASAAVLALLITILWGQRFITLLKQKQIVEGVRRLGLDGEQQKDHTPTMGGLIILMAILIPTLLLARLSNTYILLLILTTLWMGTIGFMDDYIKVYKQNKSGLAGKFKIFGQIGLGIIVSATLFFRQDVVIRHHNVPASAATGETTVVDVKATKTTLPFFKNNELDYSKIIPGLNQRYTWLVYILVFSFIISAVSNGANITDGLDGLLTGTLAISGATLAILAYLSGNAIFAQYLNIMHIPHTGELAVFCTAFVGACIGFLWYNAYPAQVFMGDTGSLALGSIVAVLAIVIRKELLLPLLGGIFLIENLSVILQVSYFRYTKRKYGAGKRLFRMAPIHHHFQKLGWHESTIVIRCWIVGILLAVLTLVTLKLR